MGKRKNSDEEEYLARKIKKLEQKMAKFRRDRHKDSSDSESSDLQSVLSDADQSEVEVINEFDMDHVPELEVQQIEEPHQDNTVPTTESNTEAEAAPELDQSILSILGDEPAKEEIFSKAIHKDIASRWSDILVNGLKEEIRKEIVESHNIPENLNLAQNPLLNPEIKAAVNENAVKRDVILSDKQKNMACVITCIGNLMSSTLDKSVTSTDNKEALKLLSDAGRLLCHMHFSETSARKNFLLACLSKEVKDSIKDLKRDRFLFGTDLSDNLKSMKAITKTGAEMRPASSKTRPQPKNKQPEASTSRALNWRGPPPAAPRRAFTQPSSTAGGRSSSRRPAAAARGSARREPRAVRGRPTTSRR